MSERERQDAEKKKASLLKQREHLQIGLSNCVDSDYYSSLQQVGTTAFDAANRWTDNIYMGRDYMTSKLGVETADANKSAHTYCVQLQTDRSCQSQSRDLIRHMLACCALLCPLVLGEFIKNPADLDYVPE